ncbi:MAG: N-acyl-D-amino acid deacylase, partial [Cyclobacteriaceae bacterium]|nr:N-acyl-D-amino acid deacylase [Cyclobacteriaceae bacterium HetDA_MAG_MS6]
MRIKTFGGFIIAAILISCRTEIKQPKDIDIYISDVQVIDGSGNVPYQAFVGVAGDEIVYLSPEPLKGISPEQHIDGKGKVITPGFIDLHSHGNPLKTPEFANFLAMGVTTISLGQDGASPAMLDIQTWMDQVDEKGIGPNLAMFVGHGTLRHLSGIGNEPSPSPEQIQSLVILLEQNLPHVFGLSTGLEYTPGLYASKEELLTLAQTVGKYDRMISSHMRNEDDDQLKTSIKELMAQGQYCRVHISHLKSVYGKGNDRALEILSWIKQARQE